MVWSNVEVVQALSIDGAKSVVAKAIIIIIIIIIIGSGNGSPMATNVVLVLFLLGVVFIRFAIC